MSGILKRTVYITQDRPGMPNGGQFQLSGWATVVTGLGMMVEQGIPMQRFSIGDEPDVSGDGDEGMTAFDYTDMMGRVDEVVIVDTDKLNSILAGDEGGMILHGGCLLPTKTGR